MDLCALEDAAPILALSAVPMASTVQQAWTSAQGQKPNCQPSLLWRQNQVNTNVMDQCVLEDAAPILALSAAQMANTALQPWTSALTRSFHW